MSSGRGRVVVEYRMLGSLELSTAGRVLPLGGRRQQVLLAVLLLNAGQTVPVDRLVADLWERPPATARRQVTNAAVAVRRAVEGAGGGPLVTCGSGYRLETAGDRLDVDLFAALGRDAERAAVAGRAADAVGLLQSALALWRGPVLAGLYSESIDAVRQGLTEQRLAAAERLAELRLELGEVTSLIGELVGMVAEHPARESLRATLMRALHLAGRPADALAVFAEGRRFLAEEFGADPGPVLRALHERILRPTGADRSDRSDGAVTRSPVPAHSATPSATPSASATHGVAHGATGPVVPRQLPAPTRSFTGRAAELARLDALLAQARGPGPATVVVSVVSGTAGAGKTALAVYWAQRVHERFPDGQLYVDLRGFDPSGQVVDPAAAARGFLDALGVAPQLIPVEPDAQIALFRSQLADRRLLVLVDNARDSAQVRPLLPGTPGCLVLVTSRNVLTGLIAAEDAHPIALGVFDNAEAEELLARRLGSDRLTAEPLAVAEIITRCARLPLALTIVAARAAAQPHLPLQVLAGELRDADRRLDVLTTDDPATDLRAVFSWSYRTLTAQAAGLFRLLGLHPGPDISAAAAASLAAVQEPDVRTHLGELVRANLLVEHTGGRYTFHDLLQAYAHDLAHTVDTERQRQAATHRLLDHYLHTAYAADRLLNPARDPITLVPARPGTTPEHLADHDRAQAWFTAEHPVLLAAVGHAAATGFDAHAWRLAWAMAVFLDLRGHWHDWAATGETAVSATRRLADPLAEVRVRNELGGAYAELGRFDDAHAHLQHALDLATTAGDLVEQGRTHSNLGFLSGRQGRHAQALDSARRAFDRYQAADHGRGQAHTLNSIGWAHAHLGEHQQALATCHQALALHQEHDNRYGQANTWHSIGYAHHHLGEHLPAIGSYRRAVELYRDLGDRYCEANVLTRLGDTQHAAGNLDAAGNAWRDALTILDQLQHPDAEALRVRLAATD